MELNENNPTKEYRKKIKGFHLAFNIRDKLDTEVSKYKYQPEGSAEEIRLKALQLKTRRLHQQKLNE